MRVKPFGLIALFAVTGAAVAIGGAPIAVADLCDPTATICQGPDLSQGSDSSLEPEPVTPTEENSGVTSCLFEGIKRC
jgi:hypothetical protein